MDVVGGVDSCVTVSNAGMMLYLFVSTCERQKCSSWHMLFQWFLELRYGRSMWLT